MDSILPLIFNSTSLFTRLSSRITVDIPITDFSVADKFHVCPYFSFSFIFPPWSARIAKLNKWHVLFFFFLFVFCCFFVFILEVIKWSVCTSEPWVILCISFTCTNFWFMHIPFESSGKFLSLTQFWMDYLPHPVVPVLKIFFISSLHPVMFQ